MLTLWYFSFNSGFLLWGTQKVSYRDIGLFPMRGRASREIGMIEGTRNLTYSKNSVLYMFYYSDSSTVSETLRSFFLASIHLQHAQQTMSKTIYVVCQSYYTWCVTVHAEASTAHISLIGQTMSSVISVKFRTLSRELYNALGNYIVPLHGGHLEFWITEPDKYRWSGVLDAFISINGSFI